MTKLVSIATIISVSAFTIATAAFAECVVSSSATAYNGGQFVADSYSFGAEPPSQQEDDAEKEEKKEVNKQE